MKTGQITPTLIRAQSGPWAKDVQLYIGRADGSLRVKDIVLEKIDPMEAYDPGPCFVIYRDVAQTLMDDLWQCGLRPTEGAGTAGSMRAVERHLADMRTIAFNKLGLEAKP